MKQRLMAFGRKNNQESRDTGSSDYFSDDYCGKSWSLAECCGGKQYLSKSGFETHNCGIQTMLNPEVMPVVGHAGATMETIQLGDDVLVVKFRTE